MDPSTHHPPFVLGKFKYPVQSLDLSYNGRLLAVGLYDGLVLLFDMIKNKLYKTLRRSVAEYGFIYGLAFDPSGHLLGVASDDGTLVIWDVDKECPVKWLYKNDNGYREGVSGEGSFEPYSIDFSFCGDFIACGEMLNGRISIWNVNTEEMELSWQAHSSHVASVKYSADGRKIVSASHDHSVGIWNANTAGGIKVDLPDVVIVEQADFSEGGDHIAAGGICARKTDGSLYKPLYLFHPSITDKLTTFPTRISNVASVAFHPKQAMLASGHLDSTITLWNLSTQEVLAHFICDFEEVRHVVFTPDGKTLVSAGWNREGQGQIELHHFY